MQSRLARIFRPATNHTVMLAIDHGYFQGPTTGLERVDLSIVPLLGYPDALMTTRGMVRSTIPATTRTPIVLRERRTEHLKGALRRAGGREHGGRVKDQRGSGGLAGLRRR